MKLEPFDRRNVAVALLFLLSIGVLGYGVHYVMAQGTPVDRSEAMRQRMRERVENNERLQRIMEQQRERRAAREQWLQDFAKATPAEQKRMLLDQQAEREARRREWRQRRAERAEQEGDGDAQRGRRNDDDSDGDGDGDRRRRGGWRNADTGQRSNWIARGNPQRQGVFQEMLRAMRDHGIGFGRRGRGR